MSNVAYGNLISGLRALGVKPGMNLIVHSSLSSFGHVEGGADAPIDALLELIAPDGTIVMPSFNHGAPYEGGGAFDIRKTPTTNGKIPDTFWRRSGAVRSMNPTHSFAAIGKNAERYTRSHQDADAMGEGSPLGLLMEDGGYCLLLGVGYTRNTFHHHVETTQNAPCLRPRGEVYPVVNENGAETVAHTWSYRSGHCPFDDGALYERDMRGVDFRVKIGDCEAILYKLSDGYAVIAEYLINGADGFPPCLGCNVRPWVNEYTI